MLISSQQSVPEKLSVVIVTDLDQSEHLSGVGAYERRPTFDYFSRERKLSPPATGFVCQVLLIV